VAELLARVKAALRRSALTAPPRAERLEAGGISLDPETRAVSVRGRLVDLRPREFELLRTLMSHPGRVWRREDLFAQVWADVEFVERGTLDVHIRWLREKVEEDPSHPVHILTVRGVGYKFVG
ncbi:MAG: response regulator transcription factor, partial [Armatimonadota bacterium]|nr:response regulator transcription factor [Armatimonadota bacterium]